VADVAQVLANNQAIVGVVVGAVLGYVLNALNRRHQEKRENETRWYEARLQAYSDFYSIYFDC
jgi:hypothetical protein